MLSLASPLSPAFPHDFLVYSEDRRERSRTSSSRSVGSFSNVGFPIYDAHGNMVATLARFGNNSFQLNNKRSFDACRSEAEIPPKGNERSESGGQIRNGAQTGDPKNRYCGSLGHQHDDESGLIYMRARYYEPASGRFLSEDGKCDGSNFFVYCSNNPVCFVDSSGSSLTDPFIFQMFGSIGNALMLATITLAWAAYYAKDPASKARLLVNAAQTLSVALASYAVALGLGTDFVLKGGVNTYALMSSFGIGFMSMIASFITGLSASAQAGLATAAIVATSINVAVAMGELFAQQAESTSGFQ